MPFRTSQSPRSESKSESNPALTRNPGGIYREVKGRLLSCVPQPLSYTMPKERPNSHWTTLGRLDCRSVRDRRRKRRSRDADLRTAVSNVTDQTLLNEEDAFDTDVVEIHLAYDPKKNRRRYPPTCPMMPSETLASCWTTSGVPFVVGAVLAVVTEILRSGMHETDAFEEGGLQTATVLSVDDKRSLRDEARV